MLPLIPDLVAPWLDFLRNRFHYFETDMKFEDQFVSVTLRREEGEKDGLRGSSALRVVPVHFRVLSSLDLLFILSI